MSLASDLENKEKRSIQRDIDLIFSVKGIVVPKTIEEHKALGIFPPSIKLKDGELYLSERGIEALKRICGFIYKTESYNELLNYDDVYDCVTSEIGSWIARKLVPEGDEFTLPLDEALSGKIDDYNFVCRIDGIELKGIESVAIGSKCIRKFDLNILNCAGGINDSISDLIENEYVGTLVIEGVERGSFSVAQSKFYSNSDLALSVLRLYSCSHYTGAIKRKNIRLINNCANAYGQASSFGWGTHNNSISFTRYFKSDQELIVDSKILSHLGNDCFFQEISILIDKRERTELESAILKSLYWLGEAQKDRSNASSWVKLWSCIECFFSLQDDEITETNAKGLASVILYGGYVHDKYHNYEELKTKIKKFYGFRSKIVHRAEYSHIDDELVIEFSYLVSWVIITMALLVHKGYKELKKVIEKAEIIDNGLEKRK